MKALEKLKIEHPEKYDSDNFFSLHCPHHYGYLEKPGDCTDCECRDCWDREIPEEVVDALCEVGNPNPVSPEELKAAMTIKDSGTRREFETGAVRDIQEGKGRCDLLPLDVVAEYFLKGNYAPDPKRSENRYWTLLNIDNFKRSGVVDYLYSVIATFCAEAYDYTPTMFLEVAKHFEEGAKKYGEYNWQKGIPTHCYIDSAVRHYLKYLRGDTDEPHDRAFVWNILCCIWTCKHKPELNDYAACEDSSVKVVSDQNVIVKTETGPQKMDIYDQPVEEDQ